LLLITFGMTYVHGSMHREWNLITAQQDATYSVYYISFGSSTCFGCWHPSSGARTTVIPASTPETCRAAYRNIIHWISRILLDSY